MDIRNIVVYDAEIKNAVPNKDGHIDHGITYCAGWQDHANMGVSVLGVYDYLEDRYRVFMDDNMDEWAELLSRKPLCVGFNSIPFDNGLLEATGWAVPAAENCYDILREMWRADGLGDTFAYPSHTGYSLDATLKANGMAPKSGNGALAPVLWQRGKIGAVIDYCLTDVAREKALMDMIMSGKALKNPKSGALLQLFGPAFGSV
jgi:DEAD/DEAH box helicase domain-containing protein